jgi:hypothetical protein
MVVEAELHVDIAFKGHMLKNERWGGIYFNFNFKFKSTSLMNLNYNSSRKSLPFTSRPPLSPTSLTDFIEISNLEICHLPQKNHMFD